jgi:hypothetical protein
MVRMVKVSIRVQCGAASFDVAVLWRYCSHLALFGLIGLTMHWLQRDAARLSSTDHLTSAGDRENGLPGSQSGTPTTGRATR